MVELHQGTCAAFVLGVAQGQGQLQVSLGGDRKSGLE